MSEMNDLKVKIRETYKQLENDGFFIGQLGKIYSRIECNRLLEYPVNNDFTLSDVGEDYPIFMENNVGTVIEIHSPYVLALSCLHEELPCITIQMKSVIGGKVTYFWQDSINAILIKNQGAYCFGKTLDDAVLCCKILESVSTVYVTSSTFGCPKEL